MATPLLKIKAFADHTGARQRRQSRLAKLPKIYYNAIAKDGTKVYVTGGYGESAKIANRPSMPLPTVYLYDANSESAIELPPMQQPRARHASVVLDDGRLVVLGGMGLKPMASVEIYDPRTRTWTFAEPLEVAMFDHTATAMGNRILISGGRSGKTIISFAIPPSGVPRARRF